MRKIALAILFTILGSIVARAQSGYTVASGFVLDPKGNPYAQCKGSAAFVPSPSATTVPLLNGSTFQTDVPISSCDSFGFMTITLADNNVVSDGHTTAPASMWNLAIQSQDGKTSFQCKITITGTTQTISSQLQACAPPLASSGGGGSGLPALPSTPNGVPYDLTSTPAGGVAVPSVWLKPGMVPNKQTGTTYLIASTDRANEVDFNNAASIAVTIPQAGTGGGGNNDFTGNFITKLCNYGAGTVTVTPTTSTITYLTGSAVVNAAANMPLTTGQCALIESDNLNYFANPGAVFGVGTISVSASTTGSATFATGQWVNAPVCVLSPKTTGLTSWYISTQNTTTLTVTVAPSGTYTFNYQCYGNPN